MTVMVLQFCNDALLDVITAVPARPFFIIAQTLRQYTVEEEAMGPVLMVASARRAESKYAQVLLHEC